MYNELRILYHNQTKNKDKTPFTPLNHVHPPEGGASRLYQGMPRVNIGALL